MKFMRSASPLWLLAAVAGMIVGPAGSAIAQRDWREGRRDDSRYDRVYDYRDTDRYDSKDLRRDYERLRDLDRRIADERRDVRESERRRDWRKARHDQDELDRFLRDRDRLLQDIDRDRDRARRDWQRNHRDRDRDRDRDYWR